MSDTLLLSDAAVNWRRRSRLQTDSVVVSDNVVVANSGAITQGSAFTISGSGFGTDTSTVLVRDVGADAAGTLSSQWTGGWPNADTSLYNMQNRDFPFSGHGGTTMSAPHAYVQRMQAGCHHGINDAYAGNNVMLFKAIASPPSFPYSLYHSVYYRHDPAWVFGLLNGDNNDKLSDWSKGSEPYDLTANWYWEEKTITSNSDAKAGSNINWHLNDDASSLETLPAGPDAAGHSWYQEWAGLDPSGDATFPYGGITNPYTAANGWIKTEFETCFSSTTGTSQGYSKIWDSSRLSANYVGATDRYSAGSRTWGLGGYNRNQGDTHNWRYYCDHYIAISTSRFVNRVIAGNNATYSSCTIREPQVTDSWSGTSIHVPAFHKGKLSAGTNYIFVLDNGGSLHSGGSVVVA